jgi:hypothetical protein
MNYDHVVSGWLGGVAHASVRQRRNRPDRARDDHARVPVAERLDGIGRIWRAEHGDQNRDIDREVDLA